jgi:hypothetical protein
MDNGTRGWGEMSSLPPTSFLTDNETPLLHAVCSCRCHGSWSEDRGCYSVEKRERRRGKGIGSHNLRMKVTAHSEGRARRGVLDAK